MSKPSLRIFVSSPGDVGPERRRALLVIQKLAKEYGRFIELVPYLWEYEPMLASGHFQDVIDPPSKTDIVVLVLWSRLGTPLPERTAVRAYQGIDGRVPVTGTEWEFEDAKAASIRAGTPDLLVYRKTADALVSLRNPQQKATAEFQWAALEEFWRRHFVDQGQFKTAYSSFETLDQFGERLEANLRKLIVQRIHRAAAGDTSPDEINWFDNPFRGLDAYRFEHAPVFFGRAEATRKAIEQLLGQTERRCSFLLVLGASGSGKSSLAQAGVAPGLLAPGVVAGVGLWRRAVMRPGASPEGPFAALVDALLAEGALPELQRGGLGRADLIAHLREAGAHPAAPFKMTLSRLAEDGRGRGDLCAHETARVLLVVDQLEELYTKGGLL